MSCFSCRTLGWTLRSDCSSSRIATEDGLNFADIPFSELGGAIEALSQNPAFRKVMATRFGKFQLTTKADRWLAQCNEMFDPMWTPNRLDWLCSRFVTLFSLCLCQVCIARIVGRACVH